jgi:hypothetical protein
MRAMLTGPPELTRPEFPGSKDFMDFYLSLRSLFDWLVTGQIVCTIPAALMAASQHRSTNSQ